VNGFCEKVSQEELYSFNVFNDICNVSDDYITICGCKKQLRSKAKDISPQSTQRKTKM